MSARNIINAAKELVEDMDEDDFDLDATLFRLRQVRVMMDAYVVNVGRFRTTFTMLTIGGLVLMLTGLVVVFGIEHGILTRPDKGPDSASLLMTTIGMGALAFGFFKRLEFTALGAQLEAQKASLDLAIEEGLRMKGEVAVPATPPVAPNAAGR